MNWRLGPTKKLPDVAKTGKAGVNHHSRLNTMFQVLALTALYEPPKQHMTSADWKKVHCDGETGCKAMKAKALAVPEYMVRHLRCAQATHDGCIS